MTDKRSNGARLGVWSGLPALLLTLGACETVGEDAPYEPNASMGMLIARDSCRSCHAVGASGESQNENAPAFRDVVNRPGMTPEGLAVWLRDAHNYPIEMGVHLEPHQVDSLVAYMMRLKAGEQVSEPM